MFYFDTCLLPYSFLLVTDHQHYSYPRPFWHRWRISQGLHWHLSIKKYDGGDVGRCCWLVGGCSLPTPSSLSLQHGPPSLQQSFLPSSGLENVPYLKAVSKPEVCFIFSLTLGTDLVARDSAMGPCCHILSLLIGACHLMQMRGCPQAPQSHIFLIL